MKVFRIKLAAVLFMVVAVVGGPLVGTAEAAGKVALVMDVGGRGVLTNFRIKSLPSSM